MSDFHDLPPPGAGEASRERAKKMADQIVLLMTGARSERFDFLAYLLAMALREVRRLVQDTR